MNGDHFSAPAMNSTLKACSTSRSYCVVSRDTHHPEPHATEARFQRPFVLEAVGLLVVVRDLVHRRGGCLAPSKALGLGCLVVLDVANDFVHQPQHLHVYVRRSSA